MDRVSPAAYRLQIGADALTKNSDDAKQNVVSRRVARTQFQNGTHAASFSSLIGLSLSSGDGLAEPRR